MSSTSLLVYRYGGIGDTLTLTSFLASMRPNFESITLLGIAERLELIDRRLWDDVIAYDSVSREMEAIAAQFDLSVAFSRERPSGFRERFDPFPPGETNIYRYMNSCARSLGGKGADYEPGVSSGRGSIIHAGSGGRAKNAPLEWFFEEARRLEDPVFVLGPAEGAAEERAIRDAGNRIERPGSLGALKELISSRAVFFGNDSGPAHLAALNGLETRIVYVNSDPAIWMPPGNVSAAAFAQPDLA